MKSFTLLFAAVLSLPAQAEWLTLAGKAGDPSSDYFQVSPDSLRVKRHLRFVGVRVSRAQAQVEDGVTYRSFDAIAVIDCRRSTARYVSAKYFEAPNFEGDPEKVQEYAASKPPVVCWMTHDGRPVKLIKSTCGVRKVETATG